MLFSFQPVYFFLGAQAEVKRQAGFFLELELFFAHETKGFIVEILRQNPEVHEGSCRVGHRLQMQL